MRLESLDGEFIELTVTGYEFPNAMARGADDWDANWLMIRGTVWDGLHSWDFHDPCITTWEARELGFWMRSAAGLGLSAPPMERLWFTEPNLSFSASVARPGAICLMAHLDAECRPPSGFSDGDDFDLRIEIAPHSLTDAAEAWVRELAAYPVR